MKGNNLGRACKDTKKEQRGYIHSSETAKRVSWSKHPPEQRDDTDADDRAKDELVSALAGADHPNERVERRHLGCRPQCRVSAQVAGTLSWTGPDVQTTLDMRELMRAMLERWRANSALVSYACLCPEKRLVVSVHRIDTYRHAGEAHPSKSSVMRVLRSIPARSERSASVVDELAVLNAEISCLTDPSKLALCSASRRLDLMRV